MSSNTCQELRKAKNVGILESHLKNLQAHMSHGQIDLGAFPVGCWVEANSVQLQFTSNLQDLEIGFGGRLAPADGNAETKTLENHNMSALELSFPS